jgi:hypothetical protein
MYMYMYMYVEVHVDNDRNNMCYMSRMTFILLSAFTCVHVHTCTCEQARVIDYRYSPKEMMACMYMYVTKASGSIACL